MENHTAASLSAKRNICELCPDRTLQFVSRPKNLLPVTLAHRRLSDLRTSSTPELAMTAMNQSATEESLFLDGNTFIHAGTQDIQCAECATECQDAACPAVAMTSQCTDQCVVVACNDPKHGQMNCHGSRHCDATCGVETDCLDCNGFDEFVSLSSFFSFSRG